MRKIIIALLLVVMSTPALALDGNDLLLRIDVQVRGL